jgi:hypothetical protein
VGGGVGGEAGLHCAIDKFIVAMTRSHTKSSKQTLGIEVGEGVPEGNAKEAQLIVEFFEVSLIPRKYGIWRTSLSMKKP